MKGKRFSPCTRQTHLLVDFVGAIIQHINVTSTSTLKMLTNSFSFATHSTKAVVFFVSVKSVAQVGKTVNV
jgi:hypothetical protein